MIREVMVAVMVMIVMMAMAVVIEMIVMMTMVGGGHDEGRGHSCAACAPTSTVVRVSHASSTERAKGAPGPHLARTTSIICAKGEAAVVHNVIVAIITIVVIMVVIVAIAPLLGR